MKEVEKYMCSVNDEVDGAMKYAERYIMFKNTRPQFAKMYHDMAEQELMHADNLRIIGEAMIDEYAYVPEDTKAEWEHCLNKAVETAGIVRFMLSK